VTDSRNRVTTMTYDVVNRMATKTLPNGVKTVYSYDDLDRIINLTYTKANGTVLVSETYTRNAGGEPSKVLREDGSYTLYEYDAALRLSKEAVYNPAGGLVESIDYSYDLDGKRTKKVDAAGTHNYNYNANGQLATVGQDGYVYDVDGRLNQVTRDSKTVVLSHDTFDHLTQVSVNGVNTQYLYDAQGNRIGEVSGGNIKNYLVAPNLGNGLESTDLVTDGNGNVVSDYVYGGGNIIARLDANGEPIYYLTDSMGSIIGLVDGNGDRVSRIIYDGFGEVKSGDDGTSLGGDFRFQGQWLETESGLYYMRARDYDVKTGLFLSRDAVDLQEQGVEAFNPYQFAFNNPLIYSDPTGLFSLSEVNASISIQNTLQTYFYNTYRQKLIDQTRGLVGQLISSTAQRLVAGLLPGGNFVDGINQILNGTTGGGQIFEKLLTEIVCDLLGRQAYSQYIDKLWLQPKVKPNGVPTADGIGCGKLAFNPNGSISTKGTRPPGAKGNEPDFIIKDGGPETTDPVKHNGKAKAFLIGDVKATWGTVAKGLGKNQGQAILNYARYQNGHQFVPIALFVTAIAGTDQEAQEIVKKGLQKNVFVYTLTLIPGLRK
jgi:RHS repeat-associated protein